MDSKQGRISVVEQRMEGKRSTFKQKTVATSRALPVIVASISLVYNVFAAFLCQYLPDDPLYIGASISAYAWSGSILSLLGFCGIIWRRPVLVTSFAHFLLLDTIMSALSRTLILEIALDSLSTHDVCRNLQPSSPPRHYELADWHEPDSGDVVAFARWQRDTMRRSPQARRCDTALSTMRIVAFGVLVCVTVAQGMLAMAMRRYSRALDQASRLSIRSIEDEEGGGYTDYEK